MESGAVDIGEYKKTRIRRAVDLWLGSDVPVYVHSTMNGGGSREIRVLVEYAGEIFDKKRLADAVVLLPSAPASKTTPRGLWPLVTTSVTTNT